MMRRHFAALLGCALVLGSSPHAAAQTPAGAPPQNDEVIVVGSSEVLLDAVVKDRKGRPVRDLTADDFEIYENGVRQRPTSFRLVTGAATRPDRDASRVAPAASDNGAGQRQRGSARAATDVRAVALVFDRLSPDARARARQAALGYAAGESGDDDFVGVFAIDLSLNIVQPFTNDLALVRRALEQSGGRGSAAFNSTASQARALNEQQTSLDATAAAAQAAVAGAGPTDNGTAGASALAANAAAQQLVAMQTRMLETFESLSRDQQGYASTNGLLAVVNAMRELPGRKAIIFFSEGLSIPPAVQSHFRTVISNANRANVSVYAVDSAGLRAESTSAAAQSELNALANRRIRQNASGREDTSGQPMSRMLERGEDLLRFDPHSGLGQLADETGGFLISNTNDAGGRLRQVDEDLHTFYALTYVPTDRNYDGRFREINVKVKRPGVEVQARKGYYAINAHFASPVMAYEAPALAALDSGRAADSFPVRAGGFDFPAPDRRARAAVLVEVPAGSYTFAKDGAQQTYRTDFTVVALARDETRQVVKKLSNQYQLTGPLATLAAAERDAVLFYREIDLPPGRYALDVAVYDALSGRTSVRHGQLDVPDVGGQALRLGSVVIVKRVERLAAGEQPHNPFHFGEALIYPLLDEPLRKSAAQELNFFLTAYAAPGAQPAPKLTLELTRAGRLIGRVPIELPPPDAAGRIQYASALPLASLQPGEYELKIMADGGGGGASSRTARFIIAP